MWVIRVIKGPQAGQTFELKNGANTVGRDNENQIPIESRGISKTHAKMVVGAEGVTLVDLNSTNGSFVNGVRVKSKQLASGDKVGFYDVIVHLHKVEKQIAAPRISTNNNNILQFPQGERPIGSPSMDGPESNQPAYVPPKTLSDTINAYLDNVVLPGVYKLGEASEFKWVIAMFVLLFVVTVTSLSLIPMIEITKSSVEKESQRRAATIVNNLAERYRRALTDGTAGTFSTSSAEREDGVQVALIIASKDGHIIAPASKEGAYADEPFIHRARKSDKKIIEQVNDSTIGASSPISVYSNDSESLLPVAHAVILYNMGALAVDNSQIIGLFFRVLAMSIGIGIILFFLLYRFIEYPIVDLNAKLDEALREQKDNIKHKYIFPALSLLTDNINSALSRAANGGGPMGSNSLHDKATEAANIVMIMGCSSMVVDTNYNIVYVNPQFEELVGMRLATIQGQNISILSDQALQLSVKDLIERNVAQPNLIASNSLELSGRQFELDSQAVMGNKGIEYVVVALKARGAEHG